MSFIPMNEESCNLDEKPNKHLERTKINSIIATSK